MANNFTTTTVFKVDITELKRSMQEAKRQIALAKSEFDLATAGMKKWSDSAEGVSAQMKFLNSTIEAQKKYVAGLQAEYDKMVASGEENTTAAEKLKIKINEQNAAIKKNEQNLESLRKQYDENGNELEELAEETKDATDKMDDMSDSSKKLGDGFTVLKGIVSNLVTDALRKLGDSLRDVITETINYESAFADVRKTVDGTEEELASLDKSIREMSTRMPQTASEIAEVSAAAGQLGIATNDIADFTETMVMLGDATNLSSTEAATSLAKFANITKMSQKDYSRLGSSIVALGNNFATTESDIVSMASRLAASGELVGLAETDILGIATALSSVGIEAEAGGTAFSKLLKQIQTAVETGSPKLEKFARVSNMTSEEFKKAFQDNGAKALASFISGLNDTERLGQSAIVTLSDMGITEARLSNAVLSLANNSDLLTNALNLSSDAWNENNALVNEASQRYKTTESRIAIMKNQIQAGLQPIIEEFIDSIDFDGVSDTVGKVAKTFASFLKVIVDNADTVLLALKGIVSGFLAMKTVNGISSLVGTFKNLASAIKGGEGAMNGLSGSIGSIVAIAVTCGVILTELAKNVFKVSEETKKATSELDKYTESNKDFVEAHDSMQKSFKNTNDLISATYDRYTALKGRLEEITDANGKVTKGKEAEAQAILNELNPALDTEYELIDGQITKYGELVGTIQDVIDMKKAEQIVSSYGDQIAQIRTNETTETQKLYDAESSLEEVQSKLAEKEKRRAEVIAEMNRESEKYGETSGALSIELSQLNVDINALKSSESEYQKSVNESQKALSEMRSTMKSYDDILVAIASGDIDAVNEQVGRLTSTFLYSSTATTEELNNMVNYYKKDYEQALAHSENFTDEEIAIKKALYEKEFTELQKSRHEQQNARDVANNKELVQTQSQFDKLYAKNSAFAEKIKQLMAKAGTENGDAFIEALKQKVQQGFDSIANWIGTTGAGKLTNPTTQTGETLWSKVTNNFYTNGQVNSTKVYQQTTRN